MNSQQLEATETTRVPRHLPYLDGLRGGAALYVVLHHALIQSIPHPPVHPHSPIEWMMKLLLGGRVAVDLFIVLSGFSLMIPVVRNQGRLPGGAMTFYFKRAKRVLPPYFAALFLSLLLIKTLIGKPTGTHWDSCLPVTTKAIVTHLLLIQDLFTDTSGKINHTLWSISVEWRIYLLFPAILWLWRRVNPMNAAFLILIASYSIFAIIPASGIDIRAISPHYFGLFAMGMIAAELCYNENDLYRKIRDRIHWKTISLFLLILAMTQGWRVQWFAEDLLIGVASASLLVGLSLDAKSPINRLLCWKPLVFIGGFAYSIYLFHAPILQIFSQYLLPGFHLSQQGRFLATLTAGALLSLVCSYAFYLLFEKPSLSYRKPQPSPIPELV